MRGKVAASNNAEFNIHSSCIIVSDANYGDIEANHERSSKENGHFCIQFEGIFEFVSKTINSTIIMNCFCV